MEATTSYPIQRLNLLMEPFCEGDECIGFVGYFPIRGMMEVKSGALIQIKYYRSIIVSDVDYPENEAIILEKSLPYFSSYFPVKYVVNNVVFDIKYSNPTPILSKFRFELFHMIPHMRHTLKIEKEKIHFCNLDLLSPSTFVPPIETFTEDITSQMKEIIEDEVKIAEAIHKIAPLAPPPPPKVPTLWDYHGFENNPPKPSPYEAFASHLDSNEDGGYCRGQWDGHLNEKTISQGVPYGIVDTHGNREKIQDILSCKLVTKENPLYQLFVDLLNAKNSHERVQFVKSYLDDRNLKYNDETFWIQEEGKPTVKQTFFKSVILKLVHQTPQYQYYLKKKNSHSA
jgi:hypothetical protein